MQHKREVSGQKPEIRSQKSAVFRLLVPVFCLLASAFCLQTSAFSQSTGSAKGKIRNVKGDAISGVSITARRDSSDVKTVQSNSKGEFKIDGLASGVYNFVFDARGYASAIRYSVEVRVGKTVDLGDRLVLRVDKGTLVIIEGSVFFKDGKVFAGAKVDVEKVNADGTTRSLPDVYTNVSGEFNFRQPEGAAKFRFTIKYKGKSTVKEIEVETAAIYRLALRLENSRND